MQGQGPGPGPGQEMQGGRFPLGFGGPGVGFGSPFGGPDVGFGSPFGGPGAGFPFGGPGAGFPFGGPDTGFPFGGPDAGFPFGGPDAGFGRPFGGPGIGFGRPFGGLGIGFGGMGPDVFSRIDQFGGPTFKPLFERMIEPPNFGRPFGGPFMNPHAPAFPHHLHEHEHEHQYHHNHHHQHQHQHQHQPSHPNTSRGIIIEELSENEEEIENDPRKHCISYQEPVVECPDDEAIGTPPEKKMKMLVPHRNEMHQIQQARSQPQSHSFTFQSSTVSYGGANGTYYTSSKTRRTGSDGLTFEECKEADTSTKQAAHRISRGLHDKGHSVTRKLNSDGHVDTVQTLHNLNEDDVVGFEEAWNGKKYLPGWRGGLTSQESLGRGSSAKRKYRTNLLEA